VGRRAAAEISRRVGLAQSQVGEDGVERELTDGGPPIADPDAHDQPPARLVDDDPGAEFDPLPFEVEGVGDRPDDEVFRKPDEPMEVDRGGRAVGNDFVPQVEPAAGHGDGL